MVPSRTFAQKISEKIVKKEDEREDDEVFSSTRSSKKKGPAFRLSKKERKEKKLEKWL